MIIRELLTRLVGFGAGLIGAHGVEVGLVATGLLIMWRGHRILKFVQNVLRTLRIGFVSAALVGLLILVALAMGWISLSGLPSLSGVLP
jgi:uncharacterized membrane protein